MPIALAGAAQPLRRALRMEPAVHSARRRLMFLPLRPRSALRYRKQRLLLAFAALGHGAALATVLFGIYGTVERRMRDEFRSYGANIVAGAGERQDRSASIVAAAETLGARSRAVPHHSPHGRDRSSPDSSPRRARR